MRRMEDMLPGSFSTSHLIPIKVGNSKGMIIVDSGVNSRRRSKDMSWSISLPNGTKLNPNIHFHKKLPIDKTRTSLKQLRCIPVEQQAEAEFSGSIMCQPCSGRGWLLCDFCNGQKTNVKAANTKIYRRCPSCKAVGFILCSKCKVYKCLTFPDFDDGEDLII